MFATILKVHFTVCAAPPEKADLRGVGQKEAEPGPGAIPRIKLVLLGDSVRIQHEAVLTVLASLDGRMTPNVAFAMQPYVSFLDRLDLTVFWCFAGRGEILPSAAVCEGPVRPEQQGHCWRCIHEPLSQSP